MRSRCIYCGIKRKSQMRNCPKCGNEYRELIPIERLPFAPLNPYVAEMYVRAMVNGDTRILQPDLDRLVEIVRSGNFYVADAMYDGFIEGFGSTDSRGNSVSIKLKSMTGDPIDTEINVGISSQRFEKGEIGRVHVFRIPYKKKYIYHVGEYDPSRSFLDELIAAIWRIDNYSTERSCAGLADAIFGV